MGATVLMAGVVMLVIGGAGLLASGNAGFTRREHAKPIVFNIEIVVAILLISSGLAIIFS